MPLERLRLLSILTLGAGLTAYQSGDFSKIQFVIFVGIIVPLWFPINIEKIRKWIFWKFYLWITFAFMILGIVFQAKIDTGIFFLIIFCLFYEFYGETRKNTPNRLISLLSFLIIAYQARLFLGVSLAFMVTCYSIAVMTTLIGLYRYTLNRRQDFKDLFKSHFLSYCHAIPILILAIGFYWVTPRLRGSEHGIESNTVGENITGFSDRVTLTDIGVLKRSMEPVLDLTILEGEPAEPYLIGRVLHRYQDGVWESLSHPRILDSARVSFNEENDFGESFAYRINTDPYNGNTMFFYKDLIRFEEFEQYIEVEGFLDNISLAKDLPSSINYNARSGKGRIKEIDLNYQRIFLWLDPDQKDDLQNYAKNILGPNADQLNNEEKANLIRNHFLRTFNYTLTINNFDADDPIQDFLNKKEGHCELFASSTALLLRSVKVPTRLVTGFLLNQSGVEGEFYHVTESMAHAWLEYYHDGAWVTLDPTPAMPVPPPSLFRQNALSFRYFWRTYFVAWDTYSQRDAIEAFLEHYGKHKAIYKNTSTLLIVALLLGTLFWFWIRQYRLDPQHKLQRLLNSIESHLAEEFRPRTPNERLEDYIKRIDLAPRVEIRTQQFVLNAFRYCYGRQTGSNNPRELIREGKQVLSLLGVRNRLDIMFI